MAGPAGGRGANDSVSLKVEGADDLAVMAKVLRELGDKELRSELYRGLNRAMKKPKADVRKSATDVLPRRGGLNTRIAKSKLATKRRTGTRTAGIRLVGTSGYDIGAVNRGRLRHPVYGNRHIWVTQTVTPGWWSKPLEASAPQIRKELVEVMDDLAHKVAKRIS